MAKHVAETNAVEVPLKTAIALERGIWVRRSFSQKLTESGARRDRRSDASHSHFVEVLEKLRGYLKPIMKAGLFKPDDLDKKPDVKANHPAEGMFDVLNVYTPSEEFLNAPDITPTPTAEPETQYTVEEEVTWEDAFFAFAALLRDYDYLSLFDSYVKHNRTTIGPGSYNGAFGSAPMAETIPRGDKAALFEVFSGFHFLTTQPGHGDVEDELVRGMDAALREKKENPPRLWISWALQMYLDIVQGLGESVGRGYEQFKQESLKIQKALVDLPKTAERRQVLQAATRWNHDPIFETSQVNVEMGLAPHDSEESPEFHFLRRPYCCTQRWSGGYYTALPSPPAKRGPYPSRASAGGYQGNACFFVGKPPMDLEGYYKNYCLCLGTSLTN
ncbi:hypothetical protein J7337_004760 [Fusarium musae]|uniref:DUF6604 domain-containing protein n=1 Tax=Fusarium musae TaxID=1042133 RepID=A0A9P8DMM3_9HYPO|nr:hypothetical protein J7337_004760 [Fusarium musae]KAG9504782.1 hypothetical protein J7337_004760 [Fusarium musae]